MNLPKKGDYVLIHSYKHDGSIHRSWEKGLVLDSNDERTIVMNQHTLVNESDGRIWYTREPAICYFPHNEWYNVICMIRKTGVHYYCNIASPTLYDDEALKYIDYDLDLKLMPDGSILQLDSKEYEFHRKKYSYSNRLDFVVKRVNDRVKKMMKERAFPFQDEKIHDYYNTFLKLKEEQEEGIFEKTV